SSSNSNSGDKHHEHVRTRDIEKGCYGGGRRDGRDSDGGIDDDDDDDDDKDGSSSQHRNDLVPAATVGEPSGEGLYACEADCPPCRTRSRAASSTRSRTVVVVPRSKRRGLLGRFSVIPEVERPYDYRNSTKWAITAALGRRTIYLTSFSLFFVFSVLCAVSTNMTMLIVFRTCSGATSASVQAVGAGTIADIWESYERGRAMSFFYLGPLLGPLIAPIIGGVLSEELGWQATMWFLAIYGFCCIIVLTCFLPETVSAPNGHGKSSSTQPQGQRGQQPGQQQVGEPVADSSLSRTVTAGSAREKTRRLASVAKNFLVDPLSVLLFLRFPPVALTVIIGAIAFGSLYVSNITLQHTYDLPPYSFNQIIVGLLYAPPGLGYITASLFGGRWIDKIMAREARKANRYDVNGKLILLPEDRMRENLWIANIVYPAALIVFGWTLHYGVHWIVPSIALYFFGVASMLVFSSVTTMLTEFVRKKSSAGVAVNNFVRNILSAIAVVVTSEWIDAVGTGWVLTTVGLACIVVGFSGILALRKNATRWRIDMDKILQDQGQQS
ncbi:Major Facilitator Superfamily, partial [Geosmithia morbida]